MKHVNTIIHQLLKYIPHYRFNHTVERLDLMNNQFLGVLSNKECIMPSSK